MLNHIHAILVVDRAAADRINPIPTLSTVIGTFKSGVSREAGFPVWQKSYHDHIIRGEDDHRMIWEYIENNPLKWEPDRYYSHD